MKGRKPKATTLHAIQGTRPHTSRAAEPQATGSIGGPPSHFTQAQRSLWAYSMQNAPPGLLRAVDASVFEAFIVAADQCRQCAEILSREGITVETERGTVEHPASRALARFSGIMLKAASECGFTPASRPRIQVQSAASTNPFESFARPEIRKPN